MDKVERMKDLVKELNKYSYEYYVLDNPSISDKQYDEKYDELLELERETGNVLSYSPTQRIGDVVLEKFEKHEHKFKCFSMDKAHTYEKLLQWHRKNELFARENNLPQIQYVVGKKFDGLTINNTYDDKGVLTKAATRGTGEKGELITDQVKTIKSIPLSINNFDLIEVHGEAVMTKKAFENYNKKAEIPLKNLRNGAAGAIKNLNVKETARRNLSAFFYDVGYSEGIKFKTYIDMMKFIEKMGLPIDNDYYLCNTIQEVKEKIDLIESLRPSLNYEIDGAIVSINDIQTRELMGYTIKFPRWAIAYKYEAEETTTTLLDVEFNTGRTGKITPRAKIEPVELMGATVKYATLNSMDDIKRKGVKIGAEVFIRRSNDVIPEILGVVEDSLTEDTKDINMPTRCKSCGSELVKDGVHYFCTNSINCKPQIVKGIANFGRLEAMNIEGFSEKTAELLVDNGIIETILDLYKLESKKDIIINLPKFGINKYNNLINAIEASKKTNLNRFLLSLGISGVGEGTSKDIAEYFKGSIDDFMDAIGTWFDFSKIKDIGRITNDLIYGWLAVEGNSDLLCNLIDILEFEIENKDSVEVKDNPFKGKKLYCTGTFAAYKKEQLKQLIESLGAEFASGYAKSLDYLVVGSIKGSGKVDKALKDGVKVLQETEFIEMIGVTNR